MDFPETCQAAFVHSLNSEKKGRLRFGLFIASRSDGIQTRGAQGGPQAAEQANENQNASAESESSVLTLPGNGNNRAAFPKISLVCCLSTRGHQVSDKKREQVTAPGVIIFAARNAFHIFLSQVSNIFLAIMTLVGFMMSVPMRCLAANTSPPADNPPT